MSTTEILQYIKDNNLEKAYNDFIDFMLAEINLASAKNASGEMYRSDLWESDTTRAFYAWYQMTKLVVK